MRNVTVTVTPSHPGRHAAVTVITEDRRNDTWVRYNAVEISAGSRAVGPAGTLAARPDEPNVFTIADSQRLVIEPRVVREEAVYDPEQHMAVPAATRPDLVTVHPSEVDEKGPTIVETAAQQVAREEADRRLNKAKLDAQARHGTAAAGSVSAHVDAHGNKVPLPSAPTVSGARSSNDVKGK